MPSNKIRSSRHLAIGKTLGWHRGGAVQRAKETYSCLEKRWTRLIFSIFARTQSDITGQDATLANQISGSAHRLLTDNNNKQSSSILCYKLLCGVWFTFKLMGLWLQLDFLDHISLSYQHLKQLPSHFSTKGGDMPAASLHLPKAVGRKLN